MVRIMYLNTVKTGNSVNKDSTIWAQGPYCITTAKL